MKFRKVSQSIKANISGVGGSGHKLNDGGNRDAVQNDQPREAIVVGPLQSEGNHAFISVRSPWEWVMDGVCTQNGAGLVAITRVGASGDLPSGKLASIAAVAVASHPRQSSTSRRRQQRGINTAATDANCTLRVEIVSNRSTGHNSNHARPWSLEVFHCTSQAFDGLDDKDELARTLKRCRCEDMNISPPSQLINWDVTKVCGFLGTIWSASPFFVVFGY